MSNEPRTPADQTLVDPSAGEPPARAIRPATVIDRYVVVRELGAGAFGVVYEARDPELDRRVALKVFREVGSERSRARFRREGRAVAQLQHPNVVAGHDVGEHDGHTFLAMELVDGMSGRQWLLAPRSVGDAVDLPVDVGAAPISDAALSFDGQRLALVRTVREVEL